MTEKITPRIDIAFKKIFGVEENKDLLMSLINSIVLEEDQVTDITLLNPYNPRNFRNDKLSVLDIKAKGHSGKRFNIEIQISDEADYDKRALYYWARLYTEQIEKSDDYSQLNKAIGIHILNFISIPRVEKYHNIFNLREKEDNFHYFKDIELHTIELNKFIGEKISKDSKHLSKSEELNKLLPSIKTSLDRWITFLTRHDLLDRNKLPSELNDTKLEKALDVLEVLNFTQEEREAYEAHLKWLRIEASTIRKVQSESFAEGKAEGKVEGKAEGLAEGEAKGEAKGEQNKAQEIAINMLKAGQQIDLVAKFTGMSEREVQTLSEQITKH